ncbi:lipopolysaccharide assembly protein LapB [Prevotella sp. lc2012]|uniref:tetratricopeptide repeat protein n=1 Tax=Prevotella sp. lc2012 TaxID=1761886 RepID=UPI000B8775DA|nr:hypothetical protein [Prevotella sp. lc2012]
MRGKTGILIFILFNLLLIGCKNQNQKILDDVAYYLQNDSVMEASACFDLLHIDNLSDKEKALYYLYEATIRYRSYQKMQSFDGIEYSINYFSKADDRNKLAEAYFYRGALKFENGITEIAIENLKQAEQLAQKDGDIKQQHKITELLSSIYCSAGLYDLGLQYAKKAMTQAVQTKNYNWYVYAIDYIATTYFQKRMNDSALYYIKKVPPYEKYLDKETIAGIYTSIGMVQSLHNPEMAKEYLYKAIALENNSSAYAVLADIEIKNNGNRQTAKNLLDSALVHSNGKDVNYIISRLTKLYMEDKEYEEACSLLLKRRSIEQDRYDIKQDLSQIQMRYDMLYKEKKQADYIHMIMTLLILVIVGILSILFYHRYQYLKNKKDMIQRQMLIETYSSKLKNLQDADDNTAKQEGELMTSINILQEKQSEALKKGKELYEHVREGQSIITWTKQDYINMIDYYSLIDIPFGVTLETEYHSLSPRYKLYLILTNMGKSEEDIEYIFGIGKSAIRSIKSRIKSKNEKTQVS